MPRTKYAAAAARACQGLAVSRQWNFAISANELEVIFVSSSSDHDVDSQSETEDASEDELELLEGPAHQEKLLFPKISLGQF